MSYRVEFSPAAQRQLDKLPRADYEAVRTAIRALKGEPRPRGVQKLADSALWRIRVRQYRVVYQVDDKSDFVGVVRIARRSEDTYTGL